VYGTAVTLGDEGILCGGSGYAVPEISVFISYRRADTSADAGRLYDALRRRFGRENLFMDVDSLRPGQDWVKAVESEVGRCDVLLALIGPDWLTAADHAGGRRLDSELDRVRLEIEAALAADKPVIPVLFEGAAMPHSGELPESLRPLVRRHAMRISHATFESDLRVLVRALKTIERAKEEVAGSGAAAAPRTIVPPIGTATPPIRRATSSPVVPPAAPARPAPRPSSPPPMGPTRPVVGPAPPQPAPTYPQPPATPLPPVPQPGGGSDRNLVIGGLAALGLLALLVIGAVFVLGQPPAPTPTPTASPTPAPTASPTPSPNATPTPTPTPTPTATATATPTATPSPSPATDHERAIARLLAMVPSEFRADCEEFAESARPSIFCFTDGMSHFYDSFDSLDQLQGTYETRIGLLDITEGVANCFDDPTPAPCEGPYRRGDLDPAGQVGAAIDDEDTSWVIYTHDTALVLGRVLSSSRDYAEVFLFWRDELVIQLPP